MADSDVDKIEDIGRSRRRGHEYFVARSTVYRKFVELERAAFEDGALSRREKELIAIGISIVNSCESCLEWHIRHALKAGASEEQVVEAIGVAMEMGIGPTTVTSRFAVAVLDQLCRPGGETAASA